MPVTHRIPGLIVIEHEIDVPLDHARPDGETITVFAREVADPDGRDRPFLVFFQGGPGYEAPRPTRHPSSPGWLDRALEDFRVLMFDQRGTGRSTPVAPDWPAERLRHFRADSIVRDAESVRRALGVERWSILGQSFGGFCAMAYLSIAPEGLREALITGGVPPVGLGIDEVYRATYERMLARNRAHYARYPEDRDRVRAIVERLEAEPVALPDGGRLTARRFRQVGSWLGMSDGSERLHYLLELPFDSLAFRHDAAAALDFERNPIYAVIHEASYADGLRTGWAAQRVMPQEFAEDPTLLTGEHVFPWMFDDYSGLRPLAAAADELAGVEWPRLYDPDRLSENEVPCAATIYLEDPYVEARFAAETAQSVRGMRTWRTDEFDHNALRADGARVLGRLLDLARGRA